jgi:hypothetical protein
MPPLSPRVIVEPDDGLEPGPRIHQFGRNSLLIKQFTFTEPTLIEAVVDRRRPVSTYGSNSMRSGPAATAPMMGRTSNFRMPE